MKLRISLPDGHYQFGSQMNSCYDTPSTVGPIKRPISHVKKQITDAFNGSTEDIRGTVFPTEVAHDDSWSILSAVRVK